ncbi:MAG: DUF2167 domain-containing protein [Planctomycetota bacterium]|nr:DUF2167 domain-containing protein [Planctomycetota bacterium]
MRYTLAPLAFLALSSPLFSASNSVQGEAETPTQQAESDPLGYEVKDGKTTIAGIEFEVGPCVGHLGTYAEINVPAGLLFSGRKGTVDFLTLNQNPTGDSEFGMVLEPEVGWFVIFSYDESGYVKDDDKDELDPDDLLDVLKQGTEYGNEVRKQRGWAALEIVGWHKAPFYDPKTNDLTWATILRSEGHDTINWSTKLLGRTGTMNVDLVVGPESIDAAMPKFENLMGGYAYADGNRYAQFKPGDKIAEYGLAALVAGGAGAVAFKTGLFGKLWGFIGKLWYLILAGLAVVFSGIKKMLGIGKKDAGETGGS